jgi:predicted ATPase
LIENPEIHLHPKLQAEIADLLIFALKNDRKIIVETHSEHIINRMRLRIKEDKSLKKRINIYFFEKHEDASGYQEIEVDYDGRINYWPEEFFDQSYYDTLGLIKK